MIELPSICTHEYTAWHFCDEKVALAEEARCIGIVKIDKNMVCERQTVIAMRLAKELDPRSPAFLCTGDLQSSDDGALFECICLA